MTLIIIIIIVIITIIIIMSLQVTAPLVTQIVSQAHEPPDDALIRSLQLTTRREREREREVRLDDKLEDLRNSLPEKTKTAVNLAAEKDASSWLTVIPVKEIDLNLNKREFKDAVHLRYMTGRLMTYQMYVSVESPLMSIML